MSDEPVEIIQPGERGKISGIQNDSKNPLKVFPCLQQSPKQPQSSPQ